MAAGGAVSTCRVRIAEGGDGQPAASEEEVKVLARVGAPANVRLACQLRPTADLTVIPLLPPETGVESSRPRPNYLQGSEREIAILFADLRSFTQFAESKLPYDVVFALNQYFRGMGQAVEAAGGRLDKFIGDGVMALFGIQDDLEQGCRQALAAAAAMAEALEHLNHQLRYDLEQPLRMGIGIHAGPAIVGEMGYGPATTVTAVGDTVNTASRLETMTKDFAVQAVISAQVAQQAGADLSAFEVRQVDVRGRAEPLGCSSDRRCPRSGRTAGGRAAATAPPGARQGAWLGKEKGRAIGRGPHSNVMGEWLRSPCRPCHPCRPYHPCRASAPQPSSQASQPPWLRW